MLQAIMTLTFFFSSQNFALFELTSAFFWTYDLTIHVALTRRVDPISVKTH